MKLQNPFSPAPWPLPFGSELPANAGAAPSESAINPFAGQIAIDRSREYPIAPPVDSNNPYSN